MASQYDDGTEALNHNEYIYDASDLIVSVLEQLSVEVVFGIPGGAIEPLYNALARSQRRGGPEPVVARHEAGAAFMADGYYRETGRLGVCCSTTGPGATNMITGVASAYQDHIPMLVITAQTALKTFGKGAFQESSHYGINTVSMYKYCTRFNTLVSHVEQLEGMLLNAVMTAFQSPAGPVHLSIPSDILRTPVKKTRLGRKLSNLKPHTYMPEPRLLNQLMRYMGRSRRVVFLIGSECAQSVGTILELSILINASVITTPQGKGLVSSYHPQYEGVYGFAGHSSAEQALTDPMTDLFLAVGTSLGEWESSGWDETLLMNNKLIHIDSNTKNFSRTPMARMHICGDLFLIFDYLLDKFYRHLQPEEYSKKEEALAKLRNTAPMVDTERRKALRREDSLFITGRNLPVKILEEGRRNHERRKKAVIPLNPARGFELIDEDKYTSDASPIKPQRLMYDISRLFPPNTRYFADTGNSVAWATHYLHPLNRRVSGQREIKDDLVRVSMEFSSMGWAIGAAIGSALGNRNNPAVCITGDGSFLMSGQEISVAIQHKLAVVLIILNDQSLGMVKYGQIMSGAEQIGTDLPLVNFAQLARAVGAQAFTIRSPGDMEALDINAICNHQGPTLLDVYIDADEAPPIDVRVKALLNN